MPITSEKNRKTLEKIEDTVAFKKENEKYWKQKIPTMTCEKKLVEAFKKEAKEKEWKYTTLMNKILRERYGKEKNNNEDD
ncbi:hypothetical protein SKUN_001756 (plasmid) [Spiroplasma kunkelii CR2-3x]|uniref:Uncharacterized protein n=1 Tax=Spiroplasma kunkelii CR2-3x TaxID=273035 RepID=A0A0K2JJJ0_SPIKU|nr:hypothetical protein [Spiroplasma kunkelii]ALA98607.1 hypothetical protein SKUN_001756 [Spiroplasma kunkelii CR2-3x]